MQKNFTLCSVMVFVSLMIVLGTSSCEKEPSANEEPIAKYSATPREGNEPLQVQFVDLSDSKGTPIVSRYWDFGDGETSSLPNPIKTYYHNPKDGNNPSIYTVKLTITTGKGVTERKEENYIRVNPGMTFSVIQPDQTPYSGVVSGYGVTIRVPKGALSDKTTFSIYETRETKQFNFFEPMEFVSSFYRIAHNAKTENLFAKEADRIISTTLEIPLFPGEENRTERPSNRYLILALMDDGSVVPILGERRGAYAFARVTGLPYQATYVVAFFPSASLIDIPIELPEDVEPNYPWNTKWRIFGSMSVIKQLVALEKGDMNKPNSFYNENYSDDEASDVLGKVAGRLARVYLEFIASGMRNPIMVDHDGAYGLVFFNMNSDYTSEYKDFNSLSIANRRFGNIVVDPKQLLMVSIHNALAALQDNKNIDIKQKYTSYNVFAQYLFYSCFDNYKFPALEIPDPSNIDMYGKPQMVSYFSGLRNSIAVYLGQRADSVVEELENKDKDSDEENSVKTWARSFGENEYYDLSQSLFQPVSYDKKNYYYANHEFWIYLERKLTDIPIISLIGASGDPYGGFLQELEKVFQTAINPQQVITYELAGAVTYITLDAVIYAATDEKDRLSNLYWYFVRGKSAEKFEETILRNSEMNQEPFEFDETRFSETGVPSRENPAPTDKIVINASSVAELKSVLPFSSRAVKIKINPLAATAQLVFNPTAWELDDNGYSLKFAVYQPITKKVFTLDDDGIDANNDGLLDTINIDKFNETEDECFDSLYLLVSNVSLKTVSPIRVSIQTKAPTNLPESQILKKYVNICDPYYDYELVRTGTFPAVGLASYVLKMTSGIWRGSQELNNAQPWTHYLTIIEPPFVLHDKALLMITGGTTDSEPDLTDLATMALPFISATGTIVAIINAVPNEPLQFSDETRKRSEDAIIAYSYDKYMDGYKAREADMTWPALLPMVRSAVRAMDTVQKFVKEDKPGKHFEVNQFVVTGASKRGWTTWLTSAVDPRVCATMPIVIDVLNMPDQMDHHYKAYGEKYSTSLNDYVEMGVFDRLQTPEGISLWKIVDPVHYLNSLIMPKFIANSTGDQFFLPDSGRFYFNLIKPSISLANGVVYPENAYLYYAPNTDHGLASGNNLGVDDGTYRALLAFYLSIINNKEKPKFVWWVEEDSSEQDINKKAFRIRLDIITRPKEVLLWQATNKNGRDFRLSSIGLAWTSKKLKPFCKECGGDPGFDPESIFDEETTTEKSLHSNTALANSKGILGSIKNVENQKCLYLEGDYYQMGYQYGSLLKDEINRLALNVSLSSQDTDTELIGPLQKDMPTMWTEIVQGIADGSGINYEQLLLAHILWWKEKDLNNVADNDSSIVTISNKETPLLLTVWKPDNQNAFITLDPLGLFVTNMAIKSSGEVLSTLADKEEQVIDNINNARFALNWLNTSQPINILSKNVPYADLLYANGNKLYQIALQEMKVISVDTVANTGLPENNNWLVKYIPQSGTLSFSNEINEESSSLKISEIINIDKNLLLTSDMNETTSPIQILKTNSGGMAKAYVKAEGQIEGTIEGTIEGETEGEEGPPCICEFEDNEIIPYVGTVEVPEEGWTAFFIQVKFPGPEPYEPELKDLDYVFSTRVVVVPDTYPDTTSSTE